MNWMDEHDERDKREFRTTVIILVLLLPWAIIGSLFLFG